jgi:hypothetical protein
MANQNYLVVQNNTVTNCVIWDGNTQSWAPPSDATMLLQKTTSAMVWVNTNPISETPNYVLTEVLDAGQIGFTWDGSVLTTNQPKPSTNEVTA